MSFFVLPLGELVLVPMLVGADDVKDVEDVEDVEDVKDVEDVTGVSIVDSGEESVMNGKE
jgi:hypothetical protein